MKIDRAVLNHGFNVDDGGEGSIGKLKPLLLGANPDAEIISFNTAWKSGLFRDLLMVRFLNGKRAKKLATMIRAGDVLFGHSNGCALINEALWQLASTDSSARVNVVYFNPALDKDTPLPPQVDKCIVFHTHTDTTVGIAKRLIGHPWGEMGRTGYREDDALKQDGRYVNIAYEDLGYHGRGHSGIFQSSLNLRRCLAEVERQFAAPHPVD